MTSGPGDDAGWYVLHRRPLSYYRTYSEIRAGRLAENVVRRFAHEFMPARFLPASASEISDPGDIQGRLVAAGLQTVYMGPLCEEEARRTASFLNEVAEVLES